MSLVDYASSSEEDEPAGREGDRSSHNLPVPPPEKPHPTNDVPLKLPDASMLLNSPSLPSNTSKVAAATAQNESRKRGLKESAQGSFKIPRGNLPGGLLCPPQLTGRSNVVTEDINKLFTRRNSRAPSES